MARISRRLVASVITLTLTLTAAVAGLGLVGAPAEAANRVTPGNFTGYGFDACNTPSQETMDTWLTTSPYWAVGVYFGGVNRFCADQPNLTADWVTAQSRNRWRIIPIYVGLQASCFAKKEKARMDPTPDDAYAAARAQGRQEGIDAVKAARALGIPEASTLWFDLESYDTANVNCREAALRFLGAWTKALHVRGYESGVYSSVSTGIYALDQARVNFPGEYLLPDQIWYAWWNKQADTEVTPYLAEDAWARHRMHQYEGNVTVKFGGVSMLIDRDYLDVGRGSRPGRQPGHCAGTNLDFPRYRYLQRGNTGAMVKAGQCLLKQKGYLTGPLGFRFDRRTMRAVRQYQKTHRLGVSGALNRRTWTLILAEGRSPLVKVGSANDAVRRVQRSVNAATGAGLPVTGIFDRDTTKAVRDYQERRTLPKTGVVATETWAQLLQGRF